MALRSPEIADQVETVASSVALPLCLDNNPSTTGFVYPVDLAAEPELNLYDMAALVPIVEEAGGRFTGLDGAPGPFSGNAVASNGLLHDQVLELIGD